MGSDHDDGDTGDAQVQTHRPTKKTPWTAGQVWETFVRDKHECRWETLFRFTPTEFFDTLVPALRPPEVFRSDDGYVPGSREQRKPEPTSAHGYLSLFLPPYRHRHLVEAPLAILMLLAKLSNPRTLRPDMEHWFQDKTRLSRFINCAIQHIFTTFSYTLAFDTVRIHRDIPWMARQFAVNIGLPDPDNSLVWALIDGTFRKCLGPSEQ